MSLLRNSVTLNLAKLLRWGMTQYRTTLLVLFGLSFLNSLLEGIGISAVIPIFALINQGPTGGTDPISQFVRRLFEFVHVPYSLRYVLLFVIVLFIGKAVVLFLTNYVANLVTIRYEKATRSHLFRGTVRAGWPYLVKQKVGHLGQVLTLDTSSSAHLLFDLTTAALMVTKIVVYTIIAFNISAVITVLALALGFFAFVCFKPLFKKNRQLAEQVTGLYKDVAHYVNENIVGMKTVKALHVEEAVARRGDAFFESLRNLNLRLSTIKNATTALMQPIGLLFLIIMFAFSYKTSAFNFASFAVIVYAINQIFTQLQAGQAQLQSMTSSVPYLQSVLDYQAKTDQQAEHDAGTQPFRLMNKLCFNDISFRYEARQAVLTKLNFCVQRGEMVGLIGSSGAGKTTVVDLLLRLLTPAEGTIILDDQPAAAISLAEWRAKIGYVSQDIFLINDTITENVRFYMPGLTEADIIAAAKTAQVYNFVMNLPDQFETVVGERGLLLSAGQRQRISLARTLVRRPEVLILDEATSALDTESENLIQQAIERLRGTITIVAIAHRFSTVLSADRLLVLAEGSIVESGSPRELVQNQQSYFYKLYTLGNQELLS